jgi:hypothetical protein
VYAILDQQVQVTTRAVRTLASKMTAALMGWRQLPLADEDLGGLTVPAALLARANSTVESMVNAWTARGIWPVQQGNRDLLQRQPLLLVSAAADLLSALVPIHRCARVWVVGFVLGGSS